MAEFVERRRPSPAEDERRTQAQEERREIKDTLIAHRAEDTAMHAETRKEIHTIVVENKAEHMILHARISTLGNRVIGWLTGIISVAWVVGMTIIAYLLTHGTPWVPRS